MKGCKVKYLEQPKQIIQEIGKQEVRLGYDELPPGFPQFIFVHFWSQLIPLEECVPVRTSWTSLPVNVFWH